MHRILILVVHSRDYVQIADLPAIGAFRHDNQVRPLLKRRYPQADFHPKSISVWAGGHTLDLNLMPRLWHKIGIVEEIDFHAVFALGLGSPSQRFNGGNCVIESSCRNKDMIT